MKNLRTKPHKELIIKGKYKEFSDFYEKNKEIIYKSIIELFGEFKTTNEETLILHLWAKIDGMEWDTEFNFSRQESVVLSRDILPYFEQNEDYEVCAEILKLKKELTL
jgi:hypothetical protein